MATLRDAMAYACHAYPASDLSKAKLAKILYLADWKSALEGRAQITPIHWKFNHYGPYVTDVVDTARLSDGFSLVDDWTSFGNRRTIVKYEGCEFGQIGDEEKRTIDEIVKTVAPLSFDAFLKLVYSTYPIVVSDRGSELDLQKLAADYRNSGLAPDTRPN
jgi:uncharacterized protein YwgA